MVLNRSPGPYPLRYLLSIAMCLGLASSALVAQECPTKSELVELNDTIPAFDLWERDGHTFGGLLRGIYLADQTPSYISCMLVDQGFRTQDGTFPLQEGEGRRGDLGEAMVDLFFPIYDKGNDPGLFAAGFRLGAMFKSTIRMADDISHPLLPGNWKVGLETEIPLIFKSHGSFMVGIDKKLNDYREQILALKDSTEKKRRVQRDRNEFWSTQENRFAQTNWCCSPYIYGTVKLYHYSNGQAGDALADSLLRRNNYKSGDFSTNCAEAKLNLAYYFPGSSLLTIGVGYRVDFGAADAFEFSPAQVESYGRRRWLTHAQWRFKPFHLLWNIRRRYRDPDSECIYSLNRMAEGRIRLEGENIRGNMNNFPHQDQLQRWGGHLWLELNPMRSKATGYFVHAYYGRDYLNIRYDRIVALVMVGLSFSPQKYMPFGWRMANAVDGNKPGWHQ